MASDAARPKSRAPARGALLWCGRSGRTVDPPAYEAPVGRVSATQMAGVRSRPTRDIQCNVTRVTAAAMATTPGGRMGPSTRPRLAKPLNPDHTGELSSTPETHGETRVPRTTNGGYAMKHKS